MVTNSSNSPKWKPPWTHSTTAHRLVVNMWNKTVQLEIHPLWLLCNLIFTFSDRKLLHLWNLPQVFSMPGVQCIHLPQKAPGHRRKTSLQCATAGCSFSRCSHIILEVFRSFTIIKSTVLTIIPSPLGFTYLLLRTMLLVWWVGASSLDVIRLLAKHLLQVCEELALNDLICSWACGLSLQSAWTLQLIWEVTSPEPTISCTAKHIGEFICLQKLCGKKRGFYSRSTLCHTMASHTADQGTAQKTQHEMPLDATQHQTAAAEKEQTKRRKKGIKTGDGFDFHK